MKTLEIVTYVNNIQAVYKLTKLLTDNKLCYTVKEFNCWSTYVINNVVKMQEEYKLVILAPVNKYVEIETLIIDNNTGDMIPTITYTELSGEKHCLDLINKCGNI